MPELPDVEFYRAALNRSYAGRVLVGTQVKSPFVMRTFEPDISELHGRQLTTVERLGKRLVWKFEGGLVLLMHLMIAGRLHQRSTGKRPASKTDLAAFHFADLADQEIQQTLMLTEASPKKRASLHVLVGEAELAAFDRGGLDVLSATQNEFAKRLTSRNHTLKRALTSPQLFDGIGNAYSDEILHAAQLSPLRWTSRLNDGEIQRLYDATRCTLREWIDRLQADLGDKFPEKVTAFRPEMAVHGKFGEPCPVCSTKVQRIRYADNETNYCPRCQTDGKVLADRSLSRLLKGDWPKSIEELEEEM